MTTYTPSLRLWEGVAFDPAIANAWAPPLVTNFTLLEAAIAGPTAVVPIGGLATYTLTTANGAADQARPILQQFTGVLTGGCVVTLPNVPKWSYAQNNTTGGFNVTLTTGAGTNAVIPPDGRIYLYQADGSGDVVLPALGFGTGSGFTGPLNVAAGTSGSQAVNFSQFAPFGNPTGFIHFPGNITMQWGNGAATVGTQQITFPYVFGTTSGGSIYGVQCTIKDAPAGGSPVAIELTGNYTNNNFTVVTFNTTNGVLTPANFFWQAIGPT